MSKVIELEITPAETVMKPEEIREFNPKYMKLSAVPKYLCVSRSTALRLIDEAKNMEEFKDIEISLSHTLKLVRIEVLDRFIAWKDKRWM